MNEKGRGSLMLRSGVLSLLIGWDCRGVLNCSDFLPVIPYPSEARQKLPVQALSLFSCFSFLLSQVFFQVFAACVVSVRSFMTVV